MICCDYGPLCDCRKKIFKNTKTPYICKQWQFFSCQHKILIENEHLQASVAYIACVVAVICDFSEKDWGFG